MSWMNAENPIYLRNDFENKDNMSENGAKFDTDKKRWYIPPGQNPINFRGKGLFRRSYVPEKEFDVLDFWSVLNVPFEKREQVKKLGAKFDRALKKWYIPKNSPKGKFIDFDSFYEFWPKDLKKFIFNNKYAAQEILEESGQSIVFGAYDMETYQRVAIKLFYETSHNNKFLEAFNRESLYLQNHLKDIPNIMSVIDHGYHRAAESNFLVFNYFYLFINSSQIFCFYKNYLLIFCLAVILY